MSRSVLADVLGLLASPERRHLATVTKDRWDSGFSLE
jgi:hypothetical protein